MTCPGTSVSSGCHAEDACVLCCSGTEQDLYNILGALYTAVLFVSPQSKPACLRRSPCSLPGLPAGSTHMGALATSAGHSPLLPHAPCGPPCVCISDGDQVC